MPVRLGKMMINGRLGGKTFSRRMEDFYNIFGEEIFIFLSAALKISIKARRMKGINMQLRKMKISGGYCCGYTN